MTWLAVLSAALAGACFALAGILQQREASQRPSDESLSLGLLLSLVRRPAWLAGIGMAVLSYGFQSLALAFGPLALVQPIIVSELIFAIPLAARLKHVRIGPRTWAGVFAVAIGIATALLLASPGNGDPRATPEGWLFTVGAVGGFALLAVAVSRAVPEVARASMLAVAAAMVMGTQSALLDLTIENLGDGFLAVVTAWQTYLLVVASIVGLVLIQSAFQQGPLPASLPVFDVVEPAVAVTIGVVLFDETLAAESWRLALAGLGAAVAVVGIVVLDTSPAIRKLHERDKERAESSQAG